MNITFDEKQFKKLTKTQVEKLYGSNTFELRQALKLFEKLHPKKEKKSKEGEG